MYVSVLDEWPTGCSRGNAEFTAYVLRVVLRPSVKKSRGELQRIQRLTEQECSLSYAE